jgi:hypothetical protein
MGKLLACGLLALGWQLPAYAWGDEGHRITGYIANSYLSDTTRLQLRALVGTDDLAQIATWMDDERETLNQRLPSSSRWHYENREVCGKTELERSCPQGQCITRQIAHSTNTLQDRTATAAQHADAVRILVHLLGDLHQPLHLIDNHDRGGNDVWVYLPREKNPRRLHEVWDTRLVHMNTNRRDDRSYASILTTRFQTERSGWEIGTVDQWAAETFLLAKTYVYSPLPGFTCQITADRSTTTALPADYIQNARSVVDVQLAKAGARIALVLNQTLAQP